MPIERIVLGLNKIAAKDQLQELQNEVLAERDDFRLAHEKSRFKRAIAMALVGIRKGAGLTQTELANRAGWDKAYVSRLEGASGGLPELETLMHYANVCRAPLRLAVGDPVYGNVIELVPDRAEKAKETIKQEEVAAFYENDTRNYTSDI
ncbi:MAG: helix-turn-helix domain-containing protein [Proteobacteria bacterium]|nr:helix-turn-helix domain-containing protein [Pseudomonadota bacterium]